MADELITLAEVVVGQAFVLQTSENYTGADIAFVRIADAYHAPLMHITALDVKNLKVHYLLDTMPCFRKDCTIYVIG